MKVDAGSQTKKFNKTKKIKDDFSFFPGTMLHNELSLPGEPRC